MAITSEMHGKKFGLMSCQRKKATECLGGVSYWGLNSPPKSNAAMNNGHFGPFAMSAEA